MKYKDTLRLLLLLFITIINTILFSFSELSIKLLNEPFNYILLSIFFLITTLWFITIYYHGIRNSLKILEQSKHKNQTKFLLFGLTSYSIFLTYMFFIPGIIYLAINLTYIKWTKN